MISHDDIKHLANLARIRISQDNAKELKEDIDSIIGYVSDIQKVKGSGSEKHTDAGTIENVLRDDSNPHESGVYTKELLSAAPQRMGNHLKVKKILSRET